MRNKTLMCTFIVFALVIAGCKMASKGEAAGFHNPLARVADR
jgi:hypothetical protein